MNKILAIKNRRLGDTALWTASIEALHDLVKSPIDVAYPAAYGDLFDSDPRIKQRYPLTAEDTSTYLDTLRRIRRVGYDAVLNFHASNATAILTLLSKGKRKLIHHHSRSPRYSRYSKTIPQVGVPMSAIERDLNVVRGLGWSGISPKTKLYVGNVHTARGEELLSPFLKSGKKNLAISIGASRLSKQWPMESFIALTQILADQYRVFVLYDFPSRSPLWLKLQKTATTIHTSDLSSLIGCLSQMSGFVGSDSGVKHIAAALGVPTVTLFGPESVGEWHGYDLKRHRAIQVPVACRDNDPGNPSYSWCGHEVCPLASHACLSQISPERVVQEISSLFRD